MYHSQLKSYTIAMNCCAYIVRFATKPRLESGTQSLVSERWTLGSQELSP